MEIRNSQHGRVNAGALATICTLLSYTPLYRHISAIWDASSRVKSSWQGASSTTGVYIMQPSDPNIVNNDPERITRTDAIVEIQGPLPVFHGIREFQFATDAVHIANLVQHVVLQSLHRPSPPGSESVRLSQVRIDVGIGGATLLQIDGKDKKQARPEDGQSWSPVDTAIVLQIVEYSPIHAKVVAYCLEPDFTGYFDYLCSELQRTYQPPARAMGSEHSADGSADASTPVPSRKRSGPRLEDHEAYAPGFTTITSDPGFGRAETFDDIKKLAKYKEALND